MGRSSGKAVHPAEPRCLLLGRRVRRRGRLPLTKGSAAVEQDRRAQRVRSNSFPTNNTCYRLLGICRNRISQYLICSLHLMLGTASPQSAGASCLDVSKDRVGTSHYTGVPIEALHHSGGPGGALAYRRDELIGVRWGVDQRWPEARSQAIRPMAMIANRVIGAKPIKQQALWVPCQRRGSPNQKK